MFQRHREKKKSTDPFYPFHFSACKLALVAGTMSVVSNSSKKSPWRSSMQILASTSNVFASPDAFGGIIIASPAASNPSKAERCRVSSLPLWMGSC